LTFRDPGEYDESHGEHEIRVAPGRFAWLGATTTKKILVHGAVNPTLFETRRFATLVPGDTFWRSLQDMHDWTTVGKPKYETADIVGDKAPYVIFHIPKLHKHFPDAIFLVAVRDVVSVARSWNKRAKNTADLAWNRSHDFDAGVRYWLSCMRRLSAYLLENVPICDIFVPKLYRRDDFELKRLCHAVGIEASPLMMRRYYGVRHHRGEYVPCSPDPEEKESVLRDLPEVLSVIEGLEACRYRVTYDELFWPEFLSDVRSAQQRRAVRSTPVSIRE
jgi:hypothetical protein